MKKTPKNTKSFTYHNENPHGIKTTDCVVRALCTALEQDYYDTVMELAKFQCETGYDKSDKKGYSIYLESKGWVKMKQPKKPDGTKYTGKDFGEVYKGVCIAHIGSHHVVAIKNGVVYDTWDSSEGCIGNYWIKKE